MSLVFASRMVAMVVFVLAGYQIGEMIAGPTPDPFVYRNWYALVLAAGALGLLLGPYLTIRPFTWIRSQIQHLSGAVLAAGTVGLVIGLVIAVLLAFPLSMLPGQLGRWLPLAAALFWAYVGVSVMVMRNQDILHALGGLWPGSAAGAKAAAAPQFQMVVDTSCIIDGRIADIAQTGFVQGTLVIPQFVLDELRHIADSADSLRRTRGRRGLDILSKLQREQLISIHISDANFDDVLEVDAKLVKLAKQLAAPILTNDWNLNRVAEFQGVQVLNVNDLAQAVRTVVLPGEELRVRIIQEGNQPSQGVGFLEDGTMVVVDGGRRAMGQELPAVVTRVLQTVQGRMIFASPKLDQATERGA